MCKKKNKYYDKMKKNEDGTMCENFLDCFITTEKKEEKKSKFPPCWIQNLFWKDWEKLLIELSRKQTKKYIYRYIYWTQDRVSKYMR